MEAPETSERSGRPSGLVDMIADLLESAALWFRQEAEDTVRTKVVAPVQKLGLMLLAAAAAAGLLVFGLMLISVGTFMLLGDTITYPGALMAVGGTLVLGALIFLIIRVRLTQK